jgi:hypothetical protein
VLELVVLESGDPAVQVSAVAVVRQLGGKLGVLGGPFEFSAVGGDGSVVLCPISGPAVPCFVRAPRGRGRDGDAAAVAALAGATS